MNHNITAVSRLQKDLRHLKLNPIHSIEAEPLASNILEWHFVFMDLENTVYSGGYYHGILLFPIQYPFKAPSIIMLTPNGRFKTNTRICLSMSDYHQSSWNPSWTVSTILNGLLSFMMESTETMGSMLTTDLAKKKYATESLEFNLKNKIYRELFLNLRNKNTSELNSTEEDIFFIKDNNNKKYYNEDISESIFMNLLMLVSIIIFSFIVCYIISDI